MSETARILRSDEPAILFVGGPAVRGRALDLAGRISAATGARLVAETHSARKERGAGRVVPERLPYPVDAALGTLSGARHLILVGTAAPVAFFAYPDKPSVLSPPECEVSTLATPAEDVVGALEALAEELGVGAKPAPVQAAGAPSVPEGALTAEAAGAAIGALLPEGAIVVDEAITASAAFYSATMGAAPHDWLDVTGGAIGIGPPLATGAAVASPDRKVLCLQADGSAMYTLQALWTQAREGLDVTTVLVDNRSYEILKWELGNVGVSDPGSVTGEMMDLDRPALDWVAISRGMGVEAQRATTLDELNRHLATALRSRGPHLIDLVL